MTIPDKSLPPWYNEETTTAIGTSDGIPMDPLLIVVGVSVVVIVLIVAVFAKRK